jgi:hypothetical protein
VLLPQQQLGQIGKRAAAAEDYNISAATTTATLAYKEEQQLLRIIETVLPPLQQQVQ